MSEYYLVIYYDDGKDSKGNPRETIHMWPGPTAAACKEKYEKLMKTEWGPRVNNFDIIKSEPTLQVKRDFPKNNSEQNLVKDTKETGKNDYSNLSKAELKKILEERGVRVFYHDTLDILRQKCIESEKKK